jgi:hypothetical protein
MARIRTIKPEFHDDEKIAKLSLRARLLFIGIWNYADDAGVCRAAPNFLRSKVFPYDDVTIQEIEKNLAELEKQGMILVAERDGESMLLVKKWLVHQVINKPSKTKMMFATYAENLQWFNEHSRSTPVVIPEECAKERKGREREGNGKGIPVGVTAAPVPAAPGTQQLIALYCDLWRLRYKSTRSPDVGGRAAKRIKDLVNDFGAARAEVLIRAYLQMPDQWFVTKTHDIETLWSNLNKVSLFADSGRMITKQETRDLDTQVATKNQQLALERGEI